MKNYIFPSVYDYSDYMLKDVKNIKNVEIVTFKMSYFQKFLWHIRNIKINKISYLLSTALFNSLFKKHNFNDCVFFIFDSNPFFLDFQFYQWIKKKHNKVLLVAIVYNVINGNQMKLEVLNEFYDKVYTFDPNEASKYNYLHFWGIYSPVEHITTSTEYDISFIGLDKGRLNIIKDISNKLDKLKLKFNINIIINIDKEYGKLSNINLLKERVTYFDSIELIKKSNCLLEIVDENQTGLSLRTIESIVYKKKLLTNNKNILLSPYYDKENMEIIYDFNDISEEFIRGVYVDNAIDRDFSFKRIISEVSIVEEL
jgi:hypothetical protein